MLDVGCNATIRLKDNILANQENRLSKSILNKAIKSGNEFGWRQNNVMEVIQAAKQIPMGIIGGQVQYVLPDGTCELYWLNIDPIERQANEPWETYCNRTAEESIIKFNALIKSADIEEEALASFTFLADKKAIGVNINDFLVFMLYFDDTETDLFVS